MRTPVVAMLCLFVLLSASSCAGIQSQQSPPVQPVIAEPQMSEPAPVPAPVNPQPLPDNSSVNPSQEASKGYDWYFRRNSQHTTPGAPSEVGDWLSEYQSFYVLPNASKKIYLTFDCGYELGFTAPILDTLKEHNVKAAFFITGQYIKTHPELVKRMQQEGHFVCNHTWNHPDLSTLTYAQIQQELNQLEEAYLRLTGTPLDRYLRPPMGRYSEFSLAATQRLGYRTVFWSLAFKDWDPNQQPGAQASYQEVMNNVHPGAVILLHAVSQSNTEALNNILTDLSKVGYVFALFE